MEEYERELQSLILRATEIIKQNAYNETDVDKFVISVDDDAIRIKHYDNSRLVLAATYARED